jgi:hypothetical protein
VYCCEINVQTAGAGVLIGKAFAVDAHEAFATALRKAGKQLRRRRRALEIDRAAPPPTQAPSSVAA